MVERYGKQQRTRFKSYGIKLRYSRNGIGFSPKLAQNSTREKRMPNVKARVTQADIARAIRAVQQTGAPLAVEIAPDGTIRLVPATTVAIMPKKQPVTMF